MCEWGDTTLVPVRGKERGDWTAAEVDSCISEIIYALNSRGIGTIASCCGHGKITPRIDLRDGRVLRIETFEEAQARDRLSPTTICGEPNAVE